MAFIGQAMDSTTIIVALAFESCLNLQSLEQATMKCFVLQPNLELIQFQHL